MANRPFNTNAREASELTSALAVVRALFGIARRSRFWVAVSLVCSLASAAQQLVKPYLFLVLVNAVVLGSQSAFTHTLPLAAMVIAVGAVVSYMGKYSTARYVTESIRDLRGNFAAHIQTLPLDTLEGHNTGDLISRFNNDVQQVSGALHGLTTNLVQPVVFIGAFVFMLTISWQLLLVSCLLMPLTAHLVALTNRSTQKLSERRFETLARATSTLQNTIGGIEAVKVFNLQRVMSEKFRAVMRDVETTSLSIYKRDAMFVAVWLGLRYPPQLIVPLVGGWLALSGVISVGAVLASNQLIWSIFLPVEAFLGWARQIRQTQPALNRLRDILDTPSERRDGEVVEVSDALCPIQALDVSFSYAGDTQVLSGLTLCLRFGKVTALVGASGSGKSTAVKLLCGLYQPTAGRVLIYGHNMADISPSSARRLIALVSQDTYLFPATIAENIAYGWRGATREQIIAAAKLAGADDFIREQPQGYDTVVGERGATLSGGQRQHLAIARACLKDAPVIVLDEPTSALDSESERSLQIALNQLMRGRTVLIVTHRLALAQQAHEIVVLDDGMVRACGQHEHLLVNDDLYRRLYTQQQS